MAIVTFGIKLDKSYHPADYKNMILRSLINSITCHVLHNRSIVFRYYVTENSIITLFYLKQNIYSNIKSANH